MCNDREPTLYEALDKIVELKAALFDARLHFVQKTFSARPCTTCELVSELFKQPFGCKILADRINKSWVAPQKVK